MRAVRRTVNPPQPLPQVARGYVYKKDVLEKAATVAESLLLAEVRKKLHSAGSSISQLCFSVRALTSVMLIKLVATLRAGLSAPTGFWNLLDSVKLRQLSTLPT